MDYCECCGWIDDGNDESGRYISWFEYDESEGLLCTKCANELHAHEL